MMVEEVDNDPWDLEYMAIVMQKLNTGELPVTLDAHKMHQFAHSFLRAPLAQTEMGKKYLIYRGTKMIPKIKNFVYNWWTNAGEICFFLTLF